MLSVLIYYAFVCAEKDQNICPQCSFIRVFALLPGFRPEPGRTHYTERVDSFAEY